MDVIGKKRFRFKGNSRCDHCHIENATRLSKWSKACNECSLSRKEQYNTNDKRLTFRIEDERFPNRHRGSKKCDVCKHGDNLTILYDEVDDEWLYCGYCNGFKQLLRCWNMYTNTMVDYKERPILRSSETVIKVNSKCRCIHIYIYIPNYWYRNKFVKIEASCQIECSN